MPADFFFHTFKLKKILLHIRIHETVYTAQKMKFSIKDFFSKEEILKKSIMENFIFCAVLWQIKSIQIISLNSSNFRNSFHIQHQHRDTSTNRYMLQVNNKTLDKVARTFYLHFRLTWFTPSTIWTPCLICSVLVHLLLYHRPNSYTSDH